MKYQFMPMFWGDFFANTLHLTAQELGAYVALIGHAWEHDAKIAVTDVQRVARISNYNWQKVRPRVEQFFDTLSVPNFWLHERVHSELTKAAELSNKRKDAALQMHSKSRANASGLHPHLHLQLPTDNLNLSEEGKAPNVQMHRPQPTAAWHPRIDEADDYRSPPRQKSDNVLQPTPDKRKA